MTTIDKTPSQIARDALAAHNITMGVTFVPYSQSRNAPGKGDMFPGPCLNWKVELRRNGRPFLETDYSAGSGHCPGDKMKQPAAFDRPARFWRAAVVEWECENGYRAAWSQWGGFRRWQKPRTDAEIEAGKPREFEALEPAIEEVFYSLMMDSNVLDYPTYEDWAAEYGYDPDSRKGEAVYRSCLELALKMRAGLGESVMAELRDAFQDF